jgi:uncharacterized protein (TIGR03437 family)
VATIAGGTRVLFDGVPAPMVYALAGQVSTVVPFGVQGRTSTQVQVEYLGTRSDAVAVPIVAAMPAIFTLDRSGKGAGAILNQNLTLNGVGTAAPIGSTIVIYATGAGAMPNVLDGGLAQPPYARLIPTPTVRIGGVPASVTYAGVAPGLIAGVLQINAVVPAGVTPGSAVAVDLTVGSATSPAGVTVAIR